MVDGLSLPVPTKIEFSRRNKDADGRVEFGSVDQLIIGKYGIAPFMCSHYDLDSAFIHKIRALGSRRVTQARDVFDLHLLASMGAVVKAGSVEEAALVAARDRALSVTFEVFRSQVVSFLQPEYYAQYDSQTVWDGIVLKIAETLDHQSREARQIGM